MDTERFLIINPDAVHTHVAKPVPEDHGRLKLAVLWNLRAVPEMGFIAREPARM
jgi:hypothetical protein